MEDKRKDIEEEEEEENPVLEASKIGISFIIFLIAKLCGFSDTVTLILFIIAYVIVGYEIVINAFKNIIHGVLFDETFLMTIATVGAFAINEPAEAVAVMLFYSFGEFLTDMAVDNSKKNITKLMDLRSDYANLIIDGEITKVNPADVNIGDTIIVRPGEKVPLDGIVIEGTSFVDTSALTGESVPRKVNVDDEVLSGVINKDGLLTLKVTREFGESTVSKILDLVENATNKKAKTEKFITRFSKIYTPVVVGIAVVVAICLPFVTDLSFSESFYKALVCLVISCPCALVISIPLSYFGGLGCASKNGILIKGSNYFESLNNLDSVIFDKTGTLTKGVFEVVKIEASKGFKEEDIIKTCAYAEKHSSHPIALSILNKYDKKIDDSKLRDYKELSGKGISVKIDGDKVLVGNYKLMESNNIDYSKLNESGTLIHVAKNDKYMGYIVINDVLKDDSIKTIKELNKRGIKTIMLTGDNKKSAEEMSRKLKIGEYYAELLPGDKLDKIEDIIAEREKGKFSAFVGDGINDAPVLARIDIGIAMGGIGSDSAIEAADVVIMNDEPSKILDAMNIAKRTRKIVIENIVFSLFVKSIALVLGIVGIAAIWHAVIADVGVTVLVVINAMRTLKYNNN